MASNEEPQDGRTDGVPARDQWWFSPTLQLVAGGAVAAFQWGPISGGTANWLNWLVAVAGVLVAVFGATSLARAWRQQR